MQNLDDHERRLSAAMARIIAASDRLMEPPPAASQPDAENDTAAEVEIARLARALDEALEQNAALSGELASARERRAASNGTLESRLAEQASRIDAQAVALQRMRMVNVQMREALRSLREALEGGVADAGQINRALQAELDGLRAVRRAEVADLDLLLAALDPLLDDPEPADLSASPMTEPDDA